ncbi:MAG: 2,3-bisphosphoglycerate-independent phosphoglycerate mutase [Bacteroidetes bacterium]|nr:2,3-bisphosphoglycerate-independent phosphoglycerate mutase [Bacteroidota bacterium]
MSEHKKLILIILDGWGHNPDPETSAIARANTPFIDGLYDKYPNSELVTYGLAVGLPEGQMGNSEVGHMNIGAGRVVNQELLKINEALKNGGLKNNQTIRDAFEYAKLNNKPVHFMGLLSDGGVHSSKQHLEALCALAGDSGVSNFYIHAFTDGRDTDPKYGINYIRDMEKQLAGNGGSIASVMGRYFAMDRDNRWQRVKVAYDALVKGVGKHTTDLTKAVQESYESGETDEFIKPIIRVDEQGEPVATISEDDVVICFNFRTDRCREITMALTQQDFPENEMKKMNLHYVTMTEYDSKFENIRIIFTNEKVPNTLGEVLEDADRTQLRIAETEKYPHVTYFFSGGREDPFKGEDRKMIPSPKVATYDLQPEMSAESVKNEVIDSINDTGPDFIMLNFANPDMVGHTGVFDAVVQAVEMIDGCAREVVEAALKNDYTCLVTADHGNADFMVNADGTPNTAHSMNLVPCFLITNTGGYNLRDGKLGDLAPTILKLLDIPVPAEMTGEILI